LAGIREAEVILVSQDDVIQNADGMEGHDLLLPGLI